MDVIDLPADLRDRFAARLARGAAGPRSRSGSGDEDVPLQWVSAAQRRMWLLHRMAPDSAAYNIPVAWRVRGPLDVAALRAALRDVADRHPVLRTTVIDELGEPRAVTHPASELELQVVPATEGWLEAEAGRPFALDRELPVRAALGQYGPDDAILLLTGHHIAVDGWSIGLVAADLSAAYAARTAGRTPAFVPVEGYAQAAHRLERAADGNRLVRGLDHWRERLADAPPPACLPTDVERPADPGSDGRILTVPLPAELEEEVRRTAAARSATPFMVVLAGLVAALARWTGQEDVVVGTAVAGRDAPGVESVVGCFVNTVPVRVPVPLTRTGGDLIDGVRELLLGDLEHADVPFDRIVQEVGPGRSASGAQLFEVLAVATHVPRRALRLSGVDTTPVPVDPGTAKVDLAVSLDEVDGGTELAFTYRTALFDRAAATRLADQYLALLRHLLRDPERPVGELPMTSAVMAGVPRRRRPVPHPAGTVLSSFAAAVARHPDATAVVDRRVRYSYRELEARASAIARALRGIGVGTDDVVGVLAERSADTVAAILGVLRAGAAYLPVEPDSPAARVQELLGRARAVATVGPPGKEALAGGGRFVPVDVPGGEPASWSLAAPCDLAYVMPTSGSTGAPKGVEVEHRHLHQYVLSMLDRLGVTPGDRFLSVSTFAADLGHTGLFGALSGGGELVVCDRDDAVDGGALGHVLRGAPADHLKIVPSHLAVLLDTAGTDRAAAALLPRRTLVLGGEAAGWPLIDRIRRLAPGLRVVNHYGPTEATVGALTWEVSSGRPRPATLQLGTPLPHGDAVVLDPAGGVVPVGVPGELYLGGAAIARGYRDDPALTAARFVSGPDGQRWYRTGDRARLRSDGTIDFLGRVDDQVKIRGYRVEPGEVTAALRRAPGVRDAAVVARQDGDEAALVGYVVGDADTSAVRGWLIQRLPAHLVPGALVRLPALPLTPNGKLDRRALPAPETTKSPSAGPVIAPRSATEVAVARIWTDLLSLSPGMQDDFFDLGGHSLLAARVVARVRADLGVEVPLRRLFDSPTLRAFAGAVEELGRSERPSADVVDVEEGEL